MFRFALLIIALVLASGAVQAAEKAAGKPDKPYRLLSGLRLYMLSEDNADLGTRAEEPESALVLEGSVRGYWYPSDRLTFAAEARASSGAGVASSRTDDDDGDTLESWRSADDSFLELRQLWVESKDSFGVPSLSFKAGRQRIREERGLWWNRNFDALSVSFEDGAFHGMAAAGQNLASYRLGENRDFDADEKDRLRFLGEASYAWRKNHNVEGRFLYEDDYSGNPGTGGVYDASDPDPEDAHLLWAGLRLQGDIAPSGLSYRADGMGVFGKETVLSSTSGPGAGQRSVTGVTGRDVRGWGLDSEISWRPAELNLRPVFTLGYAFGSGDDSPNGSGTDHGFRQTGLHGNAARGQQDGRSYVRNYGEVLRPELSNLHILSAGIRVPFLESGEAGLRYFLYRLDEDASSLRSSGISATLNGKDKNVGQALDFTADIPWGEMFDVNKDHFLRKRKVSSRLRLGAFRAGDAYGSAEGETAFRAMMEFRMRF